MASNNTTTQAAKTRKNELDAESLNSHIENQVGNFLSIPEKKGSHVSRSRPEKMASQPQMPTPKVGVRKYRPTGLQLVKQYKESESIAPSIKQQ